MRPLSAGKASSPTCRGKGTRAGPPRGWLPACLQGTACRVRLAGRCCGHASVQRGGSGTQRAAPPVYTRFGARAALLAHETQSGPRPPHLPHLVRPEAEDALAREEARLHVRALAQWRDHAGAVAVARRLQRRETAHHAQRTLQRRPLRQGLHRFGGVQPATAGALQRGGSGESGGRVSGVRGCRDNWGWERDQLGHWPLRAMGGPCPPPGVWRL